MKFGTGSINLSKIPKDKIIKGKDGNSYVNIVIRENKDGAIFYGNTHSIELSQSKEDREAKTPTLYLGNAKDWDTSQGQTRPTAQQDSVPFVGSNDVLTSSSVTTDDLPF